METSKGKNLRGLRCSIRAASNKAGNIKNLFAEMPVHFTITVFQKTKWLTFKIQGRSCTFGNTAALRIIVPPAAAQFVRAFMETEARG